ESARPEVRHRVAERADARQDEPFRARDDLRVRRHDRVEPQHVERVVHGADVAHAVIDDGDQMYVLTLPLASLGEPTGLCTTVRSHWFMSGSGAPFWTNSM